MWIRAEMPEGIKRRSARAGGLAGCRADQLLMKLMTTVSQLFSIENL